MLLETANIQGLEHKDNGDDRHRRHRIAQSKVGLEELSKARQVLTGGVLAAGSSVTLAEPRDEFKRPPHLTAPIPQHAIDCQPGRPRDIRSSSSSVLSSLQPAKPRQALEDAWTSISLELAEMTDPSVRGSCC